MTYSLEDLKEVIELSSPLLFACIVIAIALLVFSGPVHAFDFWDGVNDIGDWIFQVRLKVASIIDGTIMALGLGGITLGQWLTLVPIIAFAFIIVITLAKHLLLVGIGLVALAFLWLFIIPMIF